MRYGSVCSGIEAASQAWHPLGWESAFFSEIDKFPSAVLAHQHPDVPNYGDMTKFEEWPDDTIDVLVGGTPCQDYSVAGLRAGMAGDRGALTLTYIEIAARYRPSWVVWENVPGVLSSNNGKDFAKFLGDISGAKIEVPEGGWRNSGIVQGIADAYGIAYRVLDSQYVRVDGFGRAVPQRRRRVFVVGYLGSWRRAAAVLFEPESVLGDTPPCRKAGQVAPTIPARRTAGGGLGTDFDCDGGLISNSGDISKTICANSQQSLDNEFETIMAFSSKDHGGDAGGNASPTLRAGNSDESHANAGAPPAVAYDLRGRDGGAQFEGPHNTANIRAASGGSSRSYVGEPWAVRRLTPTECERLQGFPDGFTKIPWRNKAADNCPDGPRYKALGNSMSVNVMRWIGTRIQMIEGIS